VGRDATGRPTSVLRAGAPRPEGLPALWVKAASGGRHWRRGTGDPRTVRGAARSAPREGLGRTPNVVLGMGILSARSQGRIVGEQELANQGGLLALQFGASLP
jgi:hypothetical protein